MATTSAAAAEPWLRKAADAGDAPGALNLAGLLFSSGRTDEAYLWLRRSSHRGDVLATALLSLMSVQMGNRDEARILVKNLAESGHEDLVEKLAAMVNGLSDDADSIEVAGAMQELFDLNDSARVDLLRENAEAGNVTATRTLGYVLMFRGEVAEAESLWRQNADAGDAPSAFALGIFAEERECQGEAEEWFRRAAMAGMSDLAHVKAVNRMREPVSSDGAAGA